MAGIDAVPGYGDINASNAKEIYKAYKRGEIELTTAQQHYAEKFLTEEDWDEIEYDTGAANKSGQEQVGDAKNAREHGGQGGNVALSFAPEAILTTLGICLVADGFNQWFCALAANVCGLAGVATAMMYDNGYKDRTEANDNADGTNEVIDAHKDTLEESMDLMNEDMEVYQGKSDDLTFAMNDTAAQIAALKADLADAEAVGNMKKAAELRKPIEALQQGDFSAEEGEMEELKENMEEYKAFNAESLGVLDGGSAVSEFLKEGTWLAIPAVIHAAFYTVAAAMAGFAAAGSMPKLAPFFFDAPSSMMAKVLLGVAAGLMGFAAAKFGMKAKKEFECGSSGRDMEGHVNDLDAMIQQQQQYVDTTDETYTGIDEKAGEDRENGQEAANKLTPGGGGKKPEDKDKDKDPNPGAGATA